MINKCHFSSNIEKTLREGLGLCLIEGHLICTRDDHYFMTRMKQNINRSLGQSTVNG